MSTQTDKKRANSRHYWHEYAKKGLHKGSTRITRYKCPFCHSLRHNLDTFNVPAETGMVEQTMNGRGSISNVVVVEESEEYKQAVKRKIQELLRLL